MDQDGARFDRDSLQRAAKQLGFAANSVTSVEKERTHDLLVSPRESRIEVLGRERREYNGLAGEALPREAAGKLGRSEQALDRRV